MAKDIFANLALSFEEAKTFVLWNPAKRSKKCDSDNHSPLMSDARMDFDISDSTTAEQLKMLIKTSNSILNSLPGAGGGSTEAGVLVGNLHAHQLVSTNSFELNGCGTSISEDSGLPYTNSSVSSGDSIRCVGLCKLELEVSLGDAMKYGQCGIGFQFVFYFKWSAISFNSSFCLCLF